MASMFDKGILSDIFQLKFPYHLDWVYSNGHLKKSPAHLPANLYRFRADFSEH
jgi:hypothetical protein